MTAATHPAAATLTAYGLGRLPAHERAEVEAHIATCSACCDALEKVGPDELLGLARAAMSTPGPATELTSADIDVPGPLVDHPRYRVLAKLGAGGMGVVYKAEHKVMGRVVALKVLNASMTANPAAAERFRREVRLASRLHHPNIVTAFDADEAGGLHFLVMEYVDGRSLDRFVAKKGPLAVPLACQFIRHAALGLQHAFEKGMVHRDIKPHNLMVTRKGQVKVLDFGLAQLAAPDERATSATTPGMTAPGMVVGTPDFVAPEQAKASAALDHRADIYSLGCTLYFLLTGRAPFPGGTSIEKLIAHVQQTPTPVTQLRPEVSPALAAVLDKMMAKKPEDRYQTPAEVAAALYPFAKAGGPVSGKMTPATHTPTVAVEVGPNQPAMTPVNPSQSVAVSAAPTDSPVRTADRADDRDSGDNLPRKRRSKKGRKKKSFFAEHPLAVGVAAVAMVVLPLLGWAVPKALAPREKVEIVPSPNPATLVEPPPAPNAAKPPTVADTGATPTPVPPIKPQPVSVPNAGPPKASGPLVVLVVLPTKDLYYPEYRGVADKLKQVGAEAKLVGLTRDPVSSVMPPGMPGGPRGGGPPGGGRPFPPKGKEKDKDGPPGGFFMPGEALPSVVPSLTLAEALKGPSDQAAGVIFLGAGVEDYFPTGRGGTDTARLIALMLSRKKPLAGFGPGEMILREHSVPETIAIRGDPNNEAEFFDEFLKAARK